MTHVNGRRWLMATREEEDEQDGRGVDWGGRAARGRTDGGGRGKGFGGGMGLAPITGLGLPPLFTLLLLTTISAGIGIIALTG